MLSELFLKSNFWADGWEDAQMLERREEVRTEHWSKLYSMFSKLPESPSLYLNWALLMSWRPELYEGCETGLTLANISSVWTKGGRERKAESRGLNDVTLQGKQGNNHQGEGCRIFLRGQAAVVKAFLCWIHCIHSFPGLLSADQRFKPRSTNVTLPCLLYQP